MRAEGEHSLSVGECAANGPGLGEALSLWTLYAADLLAIARTTARLHRSAPASQATFQRQLGSFLWHPLTPAALAISCVAAERLIAERRAMPMSTLAAACGGVGAAQVVVSRLAPRRFYPTALSSRIVTGGVGLTIGAVARCGSGGFAAWDRDDPARLVLSVALVGISLPWILADASIYASDLPGFDRIFLARHPGPAGGLNPAVHLGHHHGLDGTLLALTGVALSRQLSAFRPGLHRFAMTASLVFLTLYGSARAIEDAWYEQVVKRGWTRKRVPPLVVNGRAVTPSAWVAVLFATAGLTVWRRSRGIPRQWPWRRE